MTPAEGSALNVCFLSEQVLPTDESVEHKKSHRQSHRKKVLPEIYLTRLLYTKVGAGAGAGGCAGAGAAGSALRGGGPLYGRWERVQEQVQQCSQAPPLPSSRVEQRVAPCHLPGLSWALCV